MVFHRRCNHGEMPERPKGHDWKSCVPTKIGTEGSNPSLSARLRRVDGLHHMVQGMVQGARSKS